MTVIRGLYRCGGIGGASTGCRVFGKAKNSDAIRHVGLHEPRKGRTYGSVVTVTAPAGMILAGLVIQDVIRRAGSPAANDAGESSAGGGLHG